MFFIVFGLINVFDLYEKYIYSYKIYWHIFLFNLSINKIDSNLFVLNNYLRFKTLKSKSF